MIAANITFGSHLLEAMKQSNCKHIINTGSFSQHKEVAEYSPCCFYASTKEAFAKIIDYYCMEESFSALTLKLTDSYGRNDTRKKLFQFLDDTYKKGEPLDMTPGQQTIYLTHISDIINAYYIAIDHVLAMQESIHQQYFVAGKPQKLREVVELYKKITHLNITINWGGLEYRPSQVMHPFIGEMLPNWSPKIALEQGIEEFNHAA